MKADNVTSQSTITFFEPLKDGSSFTQSGLFQSFFGIFTAKTYARDNSIESSGNAENCEKKESNLHVYKQSVMQRETPQYSSNSSSTTLHSTSTFSKKKIKHRSYTSGSLNEAILARPKLLGVSPFYNGKDRGSEVELHLKNFSTIFKDIPKKISKTNQPFAKDSNEINSSNLKQYWMPDKQCHECYECNERFTTFRRRHHCRICGHIFCSKCCYQLLSGEIIGHPGMVRSCTYCFRLVQSYSENKNDHDGLQLSIPNLEKDGTSEVSREQVDGLFSDASIFKDKPIQRATRSRSMISLKTSPVKPEAASMTARTSHDITSGLNMFDIRPMSKHEILSTYQNDQIHLAKNSPHLQSLWLKLTDSETGVEFKDHRFRLRKFSNTVTGEELIEWLLSHEIASTKDQSSIIGQALLDAELLKSVNEFKEQSFHEEGLYHSGKKILPDVTVKFTTDPYSEQVSTPSLLSPPGISFDQVSSLVDVGNEPNWVREINLDDDIDSEPEECDGNIQSWGSIIPSFKSAFFDNAYHISDDGSSSPTSGASLSSYIEIDNQRNIIKYNRRSNGDEAKLRNKEQLDFNEPRFVDESVIEIKADYIRGYLSWHGAYSKNLNIAQSVGWREHDLRNPKISATSKQAFCKMQKLYFDYSMRILNQLFISKELEQTWSDIVVQFVKRICDTIVPNCDTNMDIAHYVHVKKVLEGQPSESRLIQGVVFTKNIVSNKMKTRLDSPVIMLLATPLEYERVHYKFASLDPVVRQEQEFFKNLTSRISRRKPDVVFSQCSVAHAARDLLYKAGITLVINVKKSVMERLSRCTGADIAKSMEQLQHIRLGSCSRFRVIRHVNGKRLLNCSDGPLEVTGKNKDATTNSYKTMIYLDGCSVSNGCTILLKKTPEQDEENTNTKASLAKVKTVFFNLLRVFYHCKLELSYLMDQQDLASSNIAIPVSSRSKLKPLSSTFSQIDDEISKTEQSNETSCLRTSTDISNSKISDTNTVISKTFEDYVDVYPSINNPLFCSSFSAPVVTESHNLNSISKSENNNFLSAFSSTLLSDSPVIPIYLPFLLTKQGELSPLRRYLPQSLYWSEKFSESSLQDKNSAKDQVSLHHPEVTSLDSKKKIGDSRLNSDEKTSQCEDMWEISTHDHFAHPKSSRGNERTKETLTSQSPFTSEPILKPSIVDKSTSVSSSPALIEQNLKDQRESRNNTPSNIISPKICQCENIQWTSQKHPFLTASLCKPINSKYVQDLLADFRANGSSLLIINKRPPLTLTTSLNFNIKRENDHPQKTMDELHDCFSLINHQHIYALYSCYSLQSSNSPYPCVLPWAVDIDFYKGNDMTLGNFLDRYCFRLSYQCPNSACERPMIEHIRSFAHGTTCMNIILKELSKPVLSSETLTWSWNTESKSTELKALSHDARSMSFAKFLELRLNTFSCSSKTDQQTALASNPGIPRFTSFQYFLRKDIVAAFKCFEINVSDIALPPPLIQFKDKTSWMKIDLNLSDICARPQYQMLVNNMNLLSKVGYERMDAIFDRITSSRQGHPFDQPFLSDQAELDEDAAISKMKREAHFDQLLSLYYEERCRLRECVDTIHLKLQSLRIKWTKRVDETKNTSYLEKATAAKPTVIGKEFNELSESNLLVEGNRPTIIAVDEDSWNELSSDFLELTCLISGLIHTWNARLLSVNEQDRQYRKGNRSSTIDLYLERPQLLETSLQSKETKSKSFPGISSSLEIIINNEGCKKFDDTDDGGHVKTSSSKQCDLNDQTDASSTNDEAASSAKSDDIQPIPIPSRSAEKLSFASKKSIRTASTMNMKSLVSQFLANPTQVQVRNPFPPEEHYLLPNCQSSGIVVRDDEPGSIIAYTLKTFEYQKYIDLDENSLLEHLSDVKSTMKNSGSFTTLPTLDGNIIESKSENLEDEMPKIFFKGPSKLSASKLANLSVSLSATSSPLSSPTHSPSPHSPHVEVQFKDSSTKFYCKVYFASQFKIFRQQFLKGSDEDYISSLSRCIRWAARGGKSGSAFHKTSDERLVLKQMSRFELHSFLELAHDYFDYVTNCVQNKRPTALSKILGVYRVSFRNISAGRSFKQDILVMENLFYKRNIKQIFDLKGSLRNRHVKTNDNESSQRPANYSNDSEVSSGNNIDLVLLDENLLTIMRDRPLYVHEHSKILIKQALSDDAKFLSSHLIIDYSLLVGVDGEKQEIVIGIIDYLRTFTWDKKLEMVVKSYGMIGRQGTRSMPTVVSPELYRNRFCEAMDRYFQVVPDRWYGLHSYSAKNKE